MLKENEVIKLTVDKPEFNLNKGDRGTILMVLSVSPVFYEIEFMNDEGETLAVETFSDSEVKLFWSPDN